MHYSRNHYHHLLQHINMMQHQYIQPAWQYYNTVNSSSLDMDFLLGDYEFSSSFTTTEDSSDVSSVLCFPTITPDDLLPFSGFSDDDSFMFPSEQYSSEEVENVFDWTQGMELPSNQGSVSLVLPQEDMEVDNQVSIPGLLKAYGEAIENEEAELAEVILRRVGEKVSPLGSTIERVGYYFCQPLDNQGDYLRQESSKNRCAAFRAFYQTLPYGRFAHLTANLAILESIPLDAETLHIFDFDMGDGVQWPPLIDAIGRGRLVRLTSIKWKEDYDSPQWSFQDTKRRLQNHAQSSGLNLEVDEKDMEEMININTRDMKKEWLVFNCMVGLPHMGRGRSRRVVSEFLKVSKGFICSTRGILTLGEGDGVEERMKSCCGFGAFLEEYLIHFHTLFQSMEWHFPAHQAEARIAMECLFLAPFVSSLPCVENWEENKSVGDVLQSPSGMESWRFSRENLMQAKEIVEEGNSMYSVKIEGVNENLISLAWRGTPLVRVSTWR